MAVHSKPTSPEPRHHTPREGSRSQSHPSARRVSPSSHAAGPENASRRSASPGTALMHTFTGSREAQSNRAVTSTTATTTTAMSHTALTGGTLTGAAASNGSARANATVSHNGHGGSAGAPSSPTHSDSTRFSEVTQASGRASGREEGGQTGRVMRRWLDEDPSQSPWHVGVDGGCGFSSRQA